MFDAASFLNQRRRWVLAITIFLWIAACVLTHLPPADVPDFHADDTVLHIVGFWGLASWFLLTLASYRVRALWRGLTIVAAMAAYAALDEFTQPFFHRQCELRDWMHDMLGAVIAIACCETLLAAYRWKPFPRANG